MVQYIFFPDFYVFPSLSLVLLRSFRFATTLGFVGFVFYSVFTGQSEDVRNSRLKLLGEDLEFES